MNIRPSRAALAALVALSGSHAMAQMQPPPVPVENPITEAKRILGKVLFWDEQLSSDNTVSCATCHMPERAGTDPRIGRHPGADGVLNTADDRFGSPGVLLATPLGDYAPDPIFAHAPQVTGRKAPPTIMAAYFTDLFWDGRASTEFYDPQTGSLVIGAFGGLESQAVGPPLSSVEMASPGRTWSDITAKIARVRPLALARDLPPDVAAALAGGADYPSLFEAAYGSPTIKAPLIAKAIATYERTLIPDQTAWDRYNAGEPGAMTPQQIHGFEAFEASNCNFCHTPPLFMDDLFRNIGVRPSAEDIGRQAVSGSPFERGAFKTPSLRNTGLHVTYMHDGRLSSLEEVMAFYAQTPGAPPRFEDDIDPVMSSVVVNPADIPDMIDFMANALTDPRVAAGEYPFDRPTLYTERASGHVAVLTGTGVPGGGGVMPEAIAVTPPMLGNQEFRVGVHGALGGAEGWLATCAYPPMGPMIDPDLMLGPAVMSGSGAGGGYATFAMPLDEGMFADGQVLYAQWRIADPGAPGGVAASPVVRFTFFCPVQGCAAPPCDPDFDQNGVADQDDVSYLINVIAGGDNPTGRDPDFDQNGVADQDDAAMLVNVIAGGGVLTRIRGPTGGAPGAVGAKRPTKSA